MSHLLEKGSKALWNRWKKVCKDESGYYYAKYEKDPKGKQQITIGETTLIILIVCLTLLCLSVLALCYKAGLLSQAITFLLVLAMLFFLAFVIVIAKARTRAVDINALLFLMALLCLVILGLNVKEIKYLFESLLSGWHNVP